MDVSWGHMGRRGHMGGDAILMWHLGLWPHLCSCLSFSAHCVKQLFCTFSTKSETHFCNASSLSGVLQLFSLEIEMIILVGLIYRQACGESRPPDTRHCWPRSLDSINSQMMRILLNDGYISGKVKWQVRILLNGGYITWKVKWQVQPKISTATSDKKTELDWN